MADYDNNNKSFNNALYGTRSAITVDLDQALKNAFGTPPPLSALAEQTDGLGGFFNLSASNGSFQLVSASNVGIFENDPVVGVLYNEIPTASGAHIMSHHLADPQTKGGTAGINTHAAATIRFAGNYLNGSLHAKHKRIALVTKNGNTITYTMDKHETLHHRHAFTATGSAGSNFDSDTVGAQGLNGTSGAVGPNMRRLVQLGYR